jgi:hypothetical protein
MMFYTLPHILTIQVLYGAAIAQQITNGFMLSLWNSAENTLTGTEKYISVKKLASLKH